MNINNLIRLTQDKVEFCNFAVRFSVFCLAFYSEFNYHKTGSIIGDGERKSWDPRGPMI